MPSSPGVLFIVSQFISSQLFTSLGWTGRYRCCVLVSLALRFLCLVQPECFSLIIISHPQYPVPFGTIQRKIPEKNKIVPHTPSYGPSSSSLRPTRIHNSLPLILRPLLRLILQLLHRLITPISINRLLAVRSELWLPVALALLLLLDLVLLVLLVLGAEFWCVWCGG